MPSQDLYKERTNLRTAVVTLIVLMFGVALLYISTSWQWLKDRSAIQSVTEQLGGLLIASVALALIWELVAKRAFLSELMSEARLAEEIRNAGIVTVPRDFYRDIDWPQLFQRTKQLDIYFAYGRTWRGANRNELLTLAKRSDVQIRVVLPDPENNTIVEDLAKRFDMSPETLRLTIKEASKDFIDIFSGEEAVVEFSLWYLSLSPLFSMYRFDYTTILTFHKHRPDRVTDIPILVVEEGGTFYKFLQDEFTAFTKEQSSLAKRVFPETE
ncbi:MAG: hypothetical protein GFH27_549293n152 [Chloroflexi bacterium AL-W]|nr:hypothetical protein [Chloroflexi bacterium AL-N1]NOK67733.1 hypothetical protein [Chloroflexi bacterium AL-N10]NOK75497.1 hypothetical protein [Chloroflexi bacterium AL-N5]NOK82285.1 hypothetical protein [Chloroflexi bacterium AL-W]NOK90130.1 hypothetical protein [Chloroflexi bacterium AL-N15]